MPQLHIIFGQIISLVETGVY